MTSEADTIAYVVLKEFDRLPPKRKPQIRGNGIREWVPLSGIVAKHGDGSFKCLALATGMKCLPATKIPSANGTVLHDWHAEVLAMRMLNHFVLQECKAVAECKDSAYIRRKVDGEPGAQPFHWREDITLHMYCSKTPCGDASMEGTMSAQDDASPWETPLPQHLMDKVDSDSPELALLGRACFSQLGVIRRKPARADAPPTLSKSCSDKIALKQCTSLLNSLTSLLVSPRGVYLSSLILPESQFSATACKRCFTAQGRMAPVRDFQGEWGDGYSFKPFEIQTTELEFEYSSCGSDKEEKAKYVASNLAMAWSCNGLAENVIGGVLQGRKQSDPRGGSAVSRAKMWALATEVAGMVGMGELAHHRGTYGDVKEGKLAAGRRKVKEQVRGAALKGWVRNTGDEAFGLSI
ncbi:hypothetical protein VP1G_09261 [Cytospora mali]|uniref:A to I editase domain-containing protein n=1 Tax=Cytospora mali TaxID=578113 RepID=A0A194VDP0_CYTMA|nr:hypothetical protein VP1G_09261 [Valsa mali var. pyri (nom. inval.)]